MLSQPLLFCPDRDTVGELVTMLKTRLCPHVATPKYDSRRSQIRVRQQYQSRQVTMAMPLGSSRNTGGVPVFRATTRICRLAPRATP